MNTWNRRGFTLVELMVVAVLGSFLVLAIYQVLITNSRTYAVNNAQILGQQSLRAGLDLLFSELREVSASGHDIVAMGPDSITVRAQRAFGLVCATDYTATPPRVTAYRLGPLIHGGDTIHIFADNNTSMMGDDVWLRRTVQSVDSTASCSGSPAQLIRIPNLASTGDTVRVGAPIRAFSTYTYGLVQLDGESYLGRSLPGGSPDPLVGPLLSSRGLAFRYLDSLGTVTTVDSLVAQIEVILRYRSPLLDSRNQPVADSIVARVYPRN